MTYISNDNSSAIHSTATALGRFIAQPKNRVGTTFKQALDVAGAVVGRATSLSGLDPQYSDIIQTQIELQQQMMQVSLISNTERTRHETNMAGVRNVRVA